MVRCGGNRYLIVQAEVSKDESKDIIAVKRHLSEFVNPRGEGGIGWADGKEQGFEQ